MADAEQYERMQTSYTEVGCDFHEQEDLLGSDYRKLQRLEMVPQRWPLARQSFSLQKCVDHLYRKSRGISIFSPPGVEESYDAACSLFGQRGGCHPTGDLNRPTKKLYDDRTAHLLCSNYWMQPIYQELLHSSSRYNATRTGERNRPSSCLARISAYSRPPKRSSTRFTDWIGGICYADTLGFRPTGPLEGRPPGQRPSLSDAASRQKK